MKKLMLMTALCAISFGSAFAYTTTPVQSMQTDTMKRTKMKSTKKTMKMKKKKMPKDTMSKM